MRNGVGKSIKDLLHVAKVLIQLLNVIVEHLDVLVHIVNLLCESLDHIDQRGNELALLGAFVKLKAVSKALQVSGFFGNLHSILLLDGKSGAGEILARAGVDLQHVALVDEKRNLDLSAGLKGCGLDYDVQELNDYVEELDEDLGDVEEVLLDLDDEDEDDFDDLSDDDFACDGDCAGCDFDCGFDDDDDDFFDEDDDEYFEVICPACGDVINFDSSIDPENLICPNCGEKFECIVDEDDLKALEELDETSDETSEEE